MPYARQSLKDEGPVSGTWIPVANPPPYYLVENRYFIARDANNNPIGLSCTGNGGTTPFDTPTQPLVANIESMQIDYGVRAPQPLPTVPKATLDAIEVLRAADPIKSVPHLALTQPVSILVFSAPQLWPSPQYWQMVRNAGIWSIRYAYVWWCAALLLP